MKVVELNIFPVKSARGITVPSAAIDAFGLIGDRRAMLIDPQGHFITQRELPDLARIMVTQGPAAMRLSLDDGRNIAVEAPPVDRRMDVRVWKSDVSAAIADDTVNATLSDWMGRPVQLVFFDGAASRIASEEWAGEATPVTFADGYQILVTTTASLAALNADMERHGETTVRMDRFRPNIVVESDEPWAEDRWSAIDIAGIRLDFVKPCARCIMTTQDQKTGSREVASPMAAMGRIRMSADRRVPGPLFGWNAVPRNEGRITLGDPMTVLETRGEGWAIKKR